MPEGVARVIEGAGIFLSLSSVLAIVIGLLVVFSNYLYHFRRLSAEESFRKFKPRIARVLMVALEILVVADIIETVTTEITSDGPIDGPLWVTGHIPVERADGQPMETRNRVTLCNCGKSKNKPLCDGSHRANT